MAPRARRLASIIVPCWNNLEHTRRCAASILEKTQAPFELIFVDNGSTDGTGAYLKALSRETGARVLANRRNLGFGPAINQGMRAAAGAYLVWLNNDAVVTTGWLERLSDCAERSSSTGAVGPHVNSDGLPPSRPRSTPEQIAALLAMKKNRRSRVVPWLTGFCLLLKRRAAEQVGLLDERFRMGTFEDYDYCLRLRQAGYRVVLAEDAYVHHHWHGSLTSLKGHGRLTAANRRLFVDKWCRVFLDSLAGAQPIQALEDPFWTPRVGK